MKEYLEIPLSELCGITYSNSNRIPDDLELMFMKEVSDHTGFETNKIHLKEAYKMKYARKINGFKFEYDGKDYILEKGKIKEASN